MGNAVRTCAVLKYCSKVLVLYLSIILISAGVLVLVLEKISEVLVLHLHKYFQMYLASCLVATYVCRNVR